jgi:hypothetical protein
MIFERGLTNDPQPLRAALDESRQGIVEYEKKELSATAQSGLVCVVEGKKWEEKEEKEERRSRSRPAEDSCDGKSEAQRR